MATAKTITAFKYRTEVIADITKHTSEFKKADTTVEKFGKTNTEAAKKSESAWSGFFKGMSKGQESLQGGKIGKKFGEEFGQNAVTAITGSIGSIGQTLGALIGTGIAPGIGTAIGSTIGSGVDTALQKVSGPILEQITHGIELNKLLERSKVHFTTFIGDEKEAVAHLEQLKKLSGDTGLRLGVLVEGSQRLEEYTGKLELTRLFMRAAADQSAKFYGDATVGFNDMADALGRIMLRGEDVGKLMKQLERQGVHWKTYIAEGLGITEKKAAALIKAGRIRGEGIATLVAQGIERHAGGTAQMMGTVGPGVEQRAGALMEIRAAEGTQRITGGIGDAYTKFAQLLDSPQAKQIVEFIDKMGGYVVDFTESAVKKAVSVGGGIAEGIMNFSPSSMVQGFTKLGDFVDTGLKTVFEIKSPSERSARVVGEPIGEGLGTGMVRKFQGYLKGKGKDEIIATLEELLKDPRIKAFLDLITRSEVGNDPNPAARLFGRLGHVPDPSQFFAATGGWPGMRVKSPTLGRMVWTHPLGGSQIEPGTARAFSQATGTNLPMDAHTQALITAWLITQTRGALQNILSGNAPGAMRQLKGTWESFAVNSPGKTAGLVNQFNAAINGAAISDSNPMPVKISTGQGQYLDRLLSQTQRGLNELKSSSSSNVPLAAPTGTRDLTATMGDTSFTVTAPAGARLKDLYVDLDATDAAIVNVIDVNKELISTTSLTAEQIAGMGVNLHKLTAPIVDVTQSSRQAYEINADIQKKNRELYISNLSLGQQMVGAFQSISGMIPGQQVGKKRGFFSKLLGFAAPFLSLIPGVGGILSTIAGAAGNIAGGNYGAAVSGIAGGFQTGGVFRRSGGGGGGSTSGHQPPGRAMGGPVYRGRSYLVGEHRPEIFQPTENGRILPNANGGLHPEHAQLLDRLARALDRFESMPAHEVVRTGARGMLRAMDSDASLTEAYGRRQRLA
jgi:hypothetical protein